MSLRKSKTGALPVSDIYSFMMENFPYFKTAPDGWKNSVRHNLSLNKCFEKASNSASILFFSFSISTILFYSKLIIIFIILFI